MQKSKSYLSRTSAIVTAAVLVAMAAVPIIYQGIANAGGIPTARSITLASSAAAATDVEYVVAFTTASTGTIQGIVVEFCDSSPIIGDSSCTTPAGFDINEAGLVFSDTIAGGVFAINGAATDTNTLVLTRTDATSITAATAVTLTLGAGGGSDGVTNPNLGNHTFYARVLTYIDNDDDSNGCTSVDDNSTCYTAASPNDFLDGGGIALSTANQLQITAKVQERLSFCVYVTSCTANTAGAARTSAFNLGNTNGVLDPAGPFVDKTAAFDIATNALSGATVVVKGDTLVSGGFDISEIGGTAAASSSGSEQFGMCLFESTGSGLTISAPYNNGGTPANCNSQTTQTSGTGSTGGAGTATFAFDTASTTAASGDTIATKPAGTTSTGTMVFIGNIAFTTEAGIYQTTLTYIATGQY